MSKKNTTTVTVPRRAHTRKDGTKVSATTTTVRKSLAPAMSDVTGPKAGPVTAQAKPTNALGTGSRAQPEPSAAHESELAEFLTKARQERRDGLLSDWQIAMLDEIGISWVDFNSSAADYRQAVAERLEELGIDDSSRLVKLNHAFIARGQAEALEPFQVAEAAAAAELAANEEWKREQSEANSAS